jgi:hypothetical protein
MLPVLTHSVALTVLPSRLARVGVAAILGLAGGLLAITMREQFADDVGEKELALEPATVPAADRPEYDHVDG